VRVLGGNSTKNQNPSKKGKTLFDLKPFSSFDAHPPPDYQRRLNSMRPQFLLALTLFGLSAFFVQTLSAAQVLVVASNGKWEMEYEHP